MSKSDLKAAMDSLEVKKPLRLPAQAPAFRAPPAPTSQGEKKSVDINISTALSTTQDAFESKDQQKISNDSVLSDSKTSVQNSSQVQNKSRGSDANLDEQSTKDQEELSDIAKSLDENPSPDLNASLMVPRASQPRRATEQDRAVTEATSVKSRLSTGYTRVPNSILMEIVSGDLSRNEIKLLLLIARMTISFNRAMVPLSKGVIERMTGIQGRAVLDAVQTLEKSGFVRKIPGDHNTPNRLGLICDDMFSKASDEKRSQDASMPKDGMNAVDQKPPVRLGEISPYKKDSSETIDLRKKISLSNLSEPLRDYFSNLKPRRKRETEYQAFESLEADFTQEQISLSLRFLIQTGTPGTGEQCHSPMAYLARAIVNILPLASSQVEKERLRKIQSHAKADKERRENEEAIREEKESAVREKAFQDAFPTSEQQAEKIAQFRERFPMLLPNSSILRKLAIGAWWELLEKTLSN
ncbi:MAG: replication protein [Deltaproteobacteria bacterium]|nr:replication protein [Deltaproteobacteria bacterium]